MCLIRLLAWNGPFFSFFIMLFMQPDATELVIKDACTNELIILQTEPAMAYGINPKGQLIPRPEQQKAVMGPRLSFIYIAVLAHGLIIV